MTANQALRHYRKAASIEGWFSSNAALLIGLVDDVQRQHDAWRGDILELGVHHGRSAVFLAGLLDPSRERLTVCDLFSTQQANISRSGLGNRDIFMRAMRMAFPDLSFLTVLEQPSAAIRSALGDARFRLIHIDAGHSAEECLSDLRLAADLLQPGGVAILDDIFRVDWPGVTEALIGFLQETTHGLVPLAAGLNKLALVRAVRRAEYAATLERLAPLYFPDPWVLKTVHLLARPYLSISGRVDNDELSIRTMLARARGWWRSRRAARRQAIVTP